MNDQSQSSFIPRNPVRGSSQPRPVKRVYLLSIISTVFFISTVTMAAGVWFYSYTLKNDLKEEQARLASEQDAFNQSSLERVLEFESRLDSAKQLFTRQIILTDVLNALEENTVASNRFQAFAYTNPGTEAATLSLTGVAQDFNATIFQREILKNHPQLATADFIEVTSGVTEEENEAGITTTASDVTFTIAYEPTMRRGAAQTAPTTDLQPSDSTPTLNTNDATSSADTTATSDAEVSEMSNEDSEATSTSAVATSSNSNVE